MKYTLEYVVLEETTIQLPGGGGCSIFEIIIADYFLVK